MDKLNLLTKLTNLFQRVNQVSYVSDQTRKRFPPIETITEEQMEQLIKLFLSLGFDIEGIYEDWKRIYKEYKKRV